MTNLDVNAIVDEALGGFKIMEGREKGSNEGIIGKVITVNNFEYCDMGENSCWAYTIKEEPEKFYFAGSGLSKIFENFLAKCGGDYEELYQSIPKTLAIKLVLEITVTKNKQHFVKPVKVK